MAYLNKNLSVLAYANGFSLWHYVTPDTWAIIQGDGYFDEAADLLKVGDMVLGNVNTVGFPETRGWGIADITSGTVTLGTVTLGVEPNKAAFVPPPTGGNVVDAECRDALAALIAALTGAGVVSKPDNKPLSVTDLMVMMKDPRYWRDQNPDCVAEVRRGFEALYPR